MNIYAVMVKLQPLHRSPAIMDKTHSMPRDGLRNDGSVPTLLTTSSMFSFRDADVLNVVETANLMGHDMDSLKLNAISESKFRKMLGVYMHKGVAGVLLIGLLAALGGPVRGND